MKRQASQLSLILAALAFAPAALAGSEIVKCIDQTGHVTLTDQPCSANAATVQLTQASAPNEVAAGSAPEADAETELAAVPQVAPIERHTTPAVLRQASWKTPPAPRSRPLAADVATLKAARLQMLMLDSAAKRQHTLAVR
jgi:hypothetical protein